MTDKEILQKAMEKVNIPGGFYIAGGVLDHLESYRLEYKEHYCIIFNHDFAKAFFGEKDKFCKYCMIKIEIGAMHYSNCPYKSINIDYWQYHLQQMILEKEPLKYIEKFL